MDETVRRSSRSNKGTNQYLERQRQAELEYINARKVHQEDAKDSGEGDEVVKCLVCGTTDENYDEDNDPHGDMIQCDTCNTWQHIKCMTGKENAEEIERYDCSLCSPSLYPNLTYAIDPASYKAKKAKKVHSVGEDEDDYANDGLESLPVENDEEEIKRPTKRRRSGISKVVDNKSQDSKLRESASRMFKDLFVRYIIPDTIAARTFQLPPDDTVESRADLLSSELEQELHAASYSNEVGKLNDMYKEKVRVLFSNLKDQKNIDMKTLVVNKVLPFSKLVRMSVNELINPDLQHFREKVDHEALDQLIVEQPHKPMYHKTHKGEELIEDPNAYEPEDMIFNRDLLAAKLKQDAENSNSAQHSDATNGENGEDSNGGTLNSGEHSPSTKSPSVGELWSCSVEYKDIQTKFSGEIKFLASSQQISNTVRRDAIGDGAFVVEGRLKDEDAEGYIEQMCKTRTFLAYLLKPHANSHDSQQFEALYEFLASRQRYGALKAKRQYVRHVYVIPYSQDQHLGVFKHMQLPEDEKDLIAGNCLVVVAIVRPDMLDVT
ncbi:LAME_0G15940g1_1 [Lachancea meyersii CBS 8951]|uniref:Transcription factor BYE1 n=1 Tax=Lachancea meyersii CBS 8951 TaxID=1266667 RepID=A0A1G4KAZ2_9SACH|nr:LAME_0G15940g1_1 [Lachancea meyersii CBS 8951]